MSARPPSPIPECNRPSRACRAIPHFDRHRACSRILRAGVLRERVLRENIRKISPPAVPAIVGVQSIPHGLLRGFLHCDVQRRVHAQALFVNGRRPVGVFEVLPYVLDEIGREIIARRRYMQSRVAPWPQPPLALALLSDRAPSVTALDSAAPALAPDAQSENKSARE